jgi:hypothetical protein
MRTKREPYRSILNILYAFQDNPEGLRNIVFRYALEKNPDRINKKTFDTIEKVYGKKIKELKDKKEIKKDCITSSANLSHFLDYLVNIRLIEKKGSGYNTRYLLNPVYRWEYLRKNMIKRIDEYPTSTIFDANFFVHSYYYKLITKERNINDLKHDDFIKLDKTPLDLVGIDSDELLLLGFPHLIIAKKDKDVYENLVKITEACRELQKIRDKKFFKIVDQHFDHFLKETHHKNKKVWTMLKELDRWHRIQLFNELIQFYKFNKEEGQLKQLTKTNWYAHNGYLTKDMINKGYSSYIEKWDTTKIKWTPYFFTKWWANFNLDTCFKEPENIEFDSESNFNIKIQKLIEDRQFGADEIKVILDWLWSKIFIVKNYIDTLDFTMVFHSFGYDLNPSNYMK